MLDLSGADTSGFEALPPGTYDAEVYEVEMNETKGGENAKLPKGTPMMNVQFKITGDEYDNRRVFRQFLVAPEKVDGKKYEHKAKMDGILVRFFEAIGYEQEDVMKADFSPDFEDMKGRSCRVTIGREEYPPGSGEFTNPVKGVKAAGAATAGNLL